MAETSAFDQLCASLKSSLGEDTARQVIRCLIGTCGGERVYIPLHLKPEIQPGEKPQELRQRLGVSRSTSYYLAKKYRI